MIQSIGALAWNGFREARRNRVTVVLGAFAIALVLLAALLTDTAVATVERVLVDVGLGAMSMMLVLLAIFLSSGLLSREIERRTIFLIVSRPLSRGLFLVARLLGNMVTLGSLLLLMGLFFCVETKLYGFRIYQAQLIAIGMLWIELLVLSSIGFVLSSFSSQIVSAVVTTGIYFAGHLSADVYHLANKAGNPLLIKAVGKFVYYILPNLEMLNFRPAAGYQIAVPAGEVIRSAAYGLGYATAMTGLAILIFSRRDFK